MNQKKHQIKSKITTDKPIGQKEENIQNIKADVLLFQAGKDTFVKPNGHNKFVSLAKNCEFVRFEDAKHEIYIEKDEIFNPYIEKVLGFYDK